eukprot:NODE_10_length_4436_cov_27.735582_g6_i1.p1 GENE.NODE_10_length_4436_cov_27.735582_g6_i1~~NODE_10_length_4436_cov_27.735582_g6_i1.p1  ORF type:complete len:838 (+),score=136.56 NODE_10_length_4436_cov_27.735582_g6_i1:55-2568(+)
MKKLKRTDSVRPAWAEAIPLSVNLSASRGVAYGSSKRSQPYVGASDIHDAAAMLQQFQRKKRPRPLNRLLLIERIELELKLLTEGCSLLWWTTLFVLFFSITLYPRDPSEELAINHNLVQMLKLADVDNVAVFGDMVAYMATLSEAASQLNPLSSVYYPHLQRLTLVKGEQSFPRPQIADADVRVGAAFSISCWVSSDVHSGLQVIAKRTTAGAVCWGLETGGRFTYANQDRGTFLPDSNYTFAPRTPFTKSSDYLLALVVNETHLTVYTNQEILYTARLPRPVTDCQGDMFVGDSGVVIAQLQFIPSALSHGEISEMVAFGQPLLELVNGRRNVDATAMTDAPSPSDTEADDLLMTHHDMKTYVHANFEAFIPQPQPEPTPPPPDVPPPGATIIVPFNDPLKLDGTNYRNVTAVWPRTLVKDGNWSISVWARYAAGGYLFYKGHSSATDQWCFKWWTYPYSLEWIDSQDRSWKRCNIAEHALSPRAWRHIVLVGVQPNILLVYVDTALQCQYEVGSFADMECPAGVTYLGMRAPGNGHLTADVRDFRTYTHALNVTEMASIHSEARECKMYSELQDSTWADSVGHSCDWYYTKMRMGQPSACDPVATRACPLACNASDICFQATQRPSQTSALPIFNRILKVPSSALCVSEENSPLFDQLVASCYANNGSLPNYVKYQSGVFSVPQHMKDYGDTAPHFATDCALLAKSKYAPCIWNTPGLKEQLARAGAANEITLTFWTKGVTHVEALRNPTVNESKWDQYAPVWVIFGTHAKTKLLMAGYPTASGYSCRGVEGKELPKTPTPTEGWVFWAVHLNGKQFRLALNSAVTGPMVLMTF